MHCDHTKKGYKLITKIPTGFDRLPVQFTSCHSTDDLPEILLIYQHKGLKQNDHSVHPGPDSWDGSNNVASVNMKGIGQGVSCQVCSHLRSLQSSHSRRLLVFFMHFVLKLYQNVCTKKSTKLYSLTLWIIISSVLVGSWTDIMPDECLILI